MTNTLFIGKVYHTFDELASTNDYARELLAKSKPAEGFAVRAVSQSAGRGQYGSTWSSEAGKNLTISIILYPRWLPASAQFQLNEVVALALFDTLAALRPPPPVLPISVKWPNDIWIGHKKVAGILIQNSLKGPLLESSVVGIGLNVNQLNFPAELTKATSLALEYGREFDLDALATALFECLEQRYLQLKSGQSQALRAAYLEQLYARGETRNFFKPDGSRFEGAIQGVAEDGRLIIQTGQGMQLFDLKEVVFAP